MTRRVLVIGTDAFLQALEVASLKELVAEGEVFVQLEGDGSARLLGAGRVQIGLVEELTALSTSVAQFKPPVETYIVQQNDAQTIWPMARHKEKAQWKTERQRFKLPPSRSTRRGRRQ